MYTWMLICALAILSAAGQLKALPAFPENSRIQEEFDPKMTEGAVGFLSNRANLYSVIPKQEETDLGGAGLREDTVKPLGDNAKLIDNMMMLLWKLTSTQNLQQSRFSKPAQAALKSSKRACFWKYCVTD
ncbi:urotensin-related peptide 1 [Stegostoma tigrinum]|uniref:urotensin-related peptide 1 n=1 Tax=Stegostoma tigrinum TaxID=3053191 RepID=UPI00202B0E21|nr:urotensin-related peptide 1 [Stegostoma tigrinum]